VQATSGGDFVFEALLDAEVHASGELLEQPTEYLSFPLGQW